MKTISKAMALIALGICMGTVMAALVSCNNSGDSPIIIPPPRPNPETEPTYSITIIGSDYGKIFPEKPAGIKAGENIFVAVIPDEGYMFESFEILCGKKKIDYDPKEYEFIMPAGDVTITAYFSEMPANKRSVAFESNGGTPISTQIVEIGQKAVVPNPAPTKASTETEKYEFDGWYSNPGFTQRFDFATEIDVNTTVYANWKPISIYSLTIETTNCAVTAKKTKGIGWGETVELNIESQKESELEHIRARASINNIEEFIQSGRKITFKMPNSDVTVYVTFGEYDFHDTVTSAGTTTINGQTYDLVYFGDFPQTKMAAGVTVDSNFTYEKGDYTYYYGSDKNWYAKHGSNYYKVEPIKWRVLEDNYNRSQKRLLLAENILNRCLFYDNQGTRSYYGQTVQPNNYFHSRVRAYLNGIRYLNGKNRFSDEFKGKGFLNTAFGEHAKMLITDSFVDNSAESATDAGNNLPQVPQYASENGSDKIFLLSEREATRQSYGFTAYNIYGLDNIRRRPVTDFAEANGVYVYSKPRIAHWWLRSPSTSAKCARIIHNNGSALGDNIIDMQVDGVVPALCVDQ